MATKHRKIVKMFTQDDCSEACWARFTEAKQRHEFLMLFEEEMLRVSRRGAPWECIAARGIEAQARRHPTFFDHPVRGAYVIGSTIYILTRRPKSLDDSHHAVRYRHNFSKRLRQFDTMTKAQFMELFGEAGFLLRLSPIRRSHVREHQREAQTRDRATIPPVKRKVGAYRRALDAGLIPPTTPAAVGG